MLSHGSVVARLRGNSVLLYSAPGSAKVLATVNGHTEFGSTPTQRQRLYECQY